MRNPKKTATSESAAVTREGIRFRPIAFGGRCYYVRKCATGQVDKADSAYRTMGGITLPDIVADKSHWVEILGRGHRCQDDVRVGDLALLKLDCFSEAGTLGVKRSPFSIYEAFVEESNVMALWRDDDGGSQHD